MNDTSATTSPAPDRKVYDLASATHDGAPWTGPPRRSVLVCSHPRSGSTLLGEALHFAGGLGCAIEYFHAGFRPHLMARWGVQTLPELAQAVTRWRTTPEGVLGSKLFWRDLEDLVRALAPGLLPPEGQALPLDTPPELYKAMAEVLAPIFPNATYVHLERRDVLRMAVSGLRAVQTQVWRQIPGVDHKQAAQAATYDRERLLNIMAHGQHSHRHWRNYFAANGVTPLAVRYEELDRDYEGTVSRLLQALGSSASPPPRRMERQATAESEAFAQRFLKESMKESIQAEAATPCRT